MARRLQLPNNTIVLAVVIVSFCVSVGCKKKEQPAGPSQPSLPVKAAAAPAKPVQAQASSAKPAQPQSAQFDFSSKKDPFRSYVQPAPPEQKPTVTQRKAMTAGLLPLQSYDVSRFKVSGIIVGLKENRALIVDPAGKGYVVKQGTAIGTNDGIITKITPSYLEVVETYREDNGQLRKRNVKLSLSQKK
jgi:type IV pilus assembly protein PilP